MHCCRHKEIFEIFMLSVFSLLQYFFKHIEYNHVFLQLNVIQLRTCVPFRQIWYGIISHILSKFIPTTNNTPLSLSVLIEIHSPLYYSFLVCVLVTNLYECHLLVRWVPLLNRLHVTANTLTINLPEHQEGRIIALCCDGVYDESHHGLVTL